jgi:hypothetical protein
LQKYKWRVITDHERREPVSVASAFVQPVERMVVLDD